ncbi:alpha-D-ribose 1-methylphosphonate 5-triphosphate diphosphatase [Fibrisoma montanum]|uniref:Alpha-D-ribose 1-methylphosphonate 5-triphosphate diphosphatase n=1 Tax=Fibrisoma montanum TaxID=2305895 RepID=A0A418MAK3_9BACT|nr:alpha-D-ribose 1-methylphosphonate 5-triphosphate diphosphatase [Fibrisoma montanum]RIV23376.1 alpha-D-ribose 1-methylphosphonate 5-triphosphate diphosphatase [Fibrisoma montanum]
MLLYNASIITPHRLIRNGYVHLTGGKIMTIGEGTLDYLSVQESIDAKGAYLLPGLIDLHTDAIDAEISPRRSADFPIDVAFRELERRMSGCGITTVYHSLHLGYTAAENNAQSKYSRREIFERVYALTRQRTLINNKIHLRFELSGIDAFETACDLLQKGYVDLLSVMDHTPGQGQVSVDSFIRMAVRQGMSEAEAWLDLAEKQATPTLSPDQLNTLLDLARIRSVAVASHDDDTAEKVDEMYAAGIRICEFPVSMEAARRGKERGMYVIGGSSNVLRGGSLSGNLGVETAIRAGVIDSLCSDYYPPSLLHAVFRLAGNGLALPEAVRLATLHPARAVGIDSLTGSIETGKQADLILVDLSEGTPLVTHTFVNGHLVAQATLQPQPELAWQA